MEGRHMRKHSQVVQQDKILGVECFLFWSTLNITVHSIHSHITNPLIPTPTYHVLTGISLAIVYLATCKLVVCFHLSLCLSPSIAIRDGTGNAP